MTTARPMVLRFTATERAIHWVYAMLFLTLVTTGLMLWVPALSAAVGQRRALRQLHILCGLALIAAPLALAAFDRRRVLTSLREIDRFDPQDWAFLRRRAALSGRFNGGQKANTIWTVTATALFAVSGLVLWQWPWFPGDWRSGASELHDLLTVVSVPVLLGHVYLGAIHASTRHALRGMVFGTVRRDWAARHHAGWVPADADDADTDAENVPDAHGSRAAAP